MLVVPLAFFVVSVRVLKVEKLNYLQFANYTTFSKQVLYYFETNIFVIGKELEENNFFKVNRSIFINIVNM